MTKNKNNEKNQNNLGKLQKNVCDLYPTAIRYTIIFGQYVDLNNQLYTAQKMKFPN